MPFELFPSSTIKNGLHGDTRDGGPIAREEIHNFLYGNAREKGHGVWMVFRKFDTSQYNKPYNRYTGQGRVYLPTGEAIGGYLYPHKDTPIRVGQKELTVSASRFRIESRMPMGVGTLVYKEFYVEYDTDPTENDILYEISYVGENTPSISPPYDRAWDIQHVQDYRGDGGRIEFYGVICRLKQSR